MTFLNDYGLYLAKFMTAIVLLLFFLVTVIAIASKAKKKESGKIKITCLNKKFHDLQSQMQTHFLNNKSLKKWLKSHAQHEKKFLQKDKKDNRVFIIKFVGDLKASQLTQLRECITAVLLVASPKDEIVIDLESGGGLVHAYGLCASQLHRIREKNIPLTVLIDKVAASGGYMMACVANQILAAPFAVIGSIGVLLQLPNFNRLLRHNYIDFEMLSAGEYKRTLTMFGENTRKGREKMQTELEVTHSLFKSFITQHRPHINIEKLATGEHWFAVQAKELFLVDRLCTSDEYLLEASKERDIYQVDYQVKTPLINKFTQAITLGLEQLYDRIFTRPHIM